MIFERARTLELLRIGSGQPKASFRDGQEAAIRHVVEGRGRLLVVQKTAWGKSFVYSARPLEYQQCAGQENDRQAGSLDAGETPILYLPGVGNRQLRTDLRGLKDHPQLAPIAELQYRRVFWRQENSKDWTLRSFFASRRGGLGLKIAADQETLEALRAAIGKRLTQNLPALATGSVAGRRAPSARE